MFDQYNKNKRRRVLDKKLGGGNTSITKLIARSIAIFLILIALVGIALLFNYIAQIKYTRYDFLSRDNLVKASESLENDLSYTNFAGGMVKISKDGVSYLDVNGKTKWNYSYNLKNPHIVTKGNYFAIVDRGYGDLYIFNKEGLEGHNKTLLPIMDAAISAYGDLYLILSDDLSSIITVFTKSGVELENKIRTIISSNGYAVGIDCSDNGQMLIAPFTYIDEGKIKSKVCFYYLGASTEGDNSNGFAGAFEEEFEDTMVGKVQFIDNTHAYALTNENIVFFEIKNNRIPAITKTKKFDKRIRSIASDKSNLVALFEDGEVISFDGKGREKHWKTDITHGYSSFEISDKYVYFIINNELKIYSMRGRLLAENEFEDEINCILIDRNLFTFNILVAFKNSISVIRLIH